jgi:hypothetical protein
MSSRGSSGRGSRTVRTISAAMRCTSSSGSDTRAPVVPWRAGRGPPDRHPCSDGHRIGLRMGSFLERPPRCPLLDPRLRHTTSRIPVAQSRSLADASGRRLRWLRGRVGTRPDDYPSILPSSLRSAAICSSRTGRLPERADGAPASGCGGSASAPT